jgi:hypothetical protein
LTEVNVRKEIARAAGVSEGNVTKVDQLRDSPSEVLKALHKGDVRIHRAWLWRTLDPERQREQLRLYQVQRGLKQKVTTLISKHRPRMSGSANPDSFTADLDWLAEWLPALLSRERQSKPPLVRVIDAPGRFIFLSSELFQTAPAPQSVE